MIPNKIHECMPKPVPAIPDLEPGCGSWIIVSKATGKAVFETFNRDLAKRINTEKYTVLTAMQYLGAFNRNLTYRQEG